MIRSNAFLLAAVSLLPFATPHAVRAQRLLEMEGIELRGTARVVEFGAATCNVVEERETETSYEQKKASHGQPIDIWQLDFSVYNGSSRPLDHLIAVYQIAAENLPCTNWSLAASANYDQPVQWGGAAGQIQRSRTPTAPGETLTISSYVWAFHDDQPRFDSWQMDYDFAPFAASAAAAPTRAETPVSVNPASPTPPAPVPDDGALREAASQRICDRAMAAMAEGDFTTARQLLDRATNDYPGTRCAESAPADIERAMAAIVEPIHYDAFVEYERYEIVGTGITDAAAAILQRKADALRDHPGIRLRVEGHADGRNSSLELSRELGLMMAQSAVDYLVGLGLDAARFDVVTFGEERPLAWDNESTWRQNRRVEFVILTGDT